MYETANEVTKELLKKDENGKHHLPAELTEDGLTSYLWDKLKGQATNLGEIKAISRLIFMHKGAIQEQARLMDENLAKCETLKNVQIKKTEVNGREIFEVTMPDGNRKVANSVEEVIANCNVLMQLDMISNSVKESLEKESTPRYDATTTKVDVKKELDDLIDKYKDSPLELFDNINVQGVIQKAREQGRDDVIALIKKAYDLTPEIDKNLDIILGENPELKVIYNTDQRSRCIIEKLFESEFKTKYNPETGEKLTDAAKLDYVKKVLNDNLGDIKKDYHYRSIKFELESGTKSEKEKSLLYKQYLDEEFGSDKSGKLANLRKMCETIDKDFGVKVILPARLDEAGVALKLVYQELSNFKMHAKENGANAKLPKVLKFSRIDNFRFIEGKASGISGQNYIAVHGLSVETIKYALRHELTHTNDLIGTFDDDFPPDVDIKSFAQEMLNAGIDVEHISYAYTNRAEFLAVASEGDMRAYSPEFKKALNKMGMPEWMLNMQNSSHSNKKVSTADRVRLQEIMRNIEHERADYDVTLAKLPASKKGDIDTPAGMNAQEDALIQKARKENPATVVEEKVRRQWQQSDLETPVPEVKVDLFNLDPYAGLKEIFPLSSISSSSGISSVSFR